MIHPSVRSFIAVAESGSFNRAAESLYISSTAVTKQIAALEERIGLKLVVRTYQGIRLTEAGQSLYEDAKGIVRFADDALGRARQAEHSGLHTIRIGSSQLYPVSQAMKLWDAISDQLSHLAINIVPFQETDRVQYLDQIGTSCDLIYAAIDRTPDSMDRNYQLLEVLPAHFCIAVPKKHPLAARKSLSPDDLSGETLMMMNPGVSPVNDEVRAMIQLQYPSIRLQSITHNYHIGLFNQCAEQGGIMLSLDLWENIHPNLVHIPLDVPQTIPCGFIYAESPSSATVEFLDAVKRYLASR